ncbi:hypothetical protein BH23CHL2_BH23CHL2_11100 [soil metagenome]
MQVPALPPELHAHLWTARDPLQHASAVSAYLLHVQIGPVDAEVSEAIGLELRREMRTEWLTHVGHTCARVDTDVVSCCALTRTAIVEANFQWSRRSG